MYTINKIQDEMNRSGSHWWDRDSMRFFGTRVSEKVYQGSGGVYFVTSEKPPHGARSYSVRRYDPAEKSIDTVGEFCSMTRDHAHREAARLAGHNAVAIEEAHRPTSQAEQLAIDIQRGGGRCSATSAAWLIRLATKHHRMMGDCCNGIDIHDEDGEPLPRLARLRSQIKEAAREHLCGVIFSGDPRGATCKLVLPNKATNSFGGEGWCIPTRD